MVGFFGLGEEGRGVDRVGLHHVDMEIAVADVAEHADFPVGIAIGEDAGELAHEGVELGDGQRDVVFVGESGGRQALADAFP